MATPDAVASAGAGAGERKENDSSSSNNNSGGGGAAAAPGGKPPLGGKPSQSQAGSTGVLQRHQDPPLSGKRGQKEWTAAHSGDRTLEPAFITRLRTAAVDDYRYVVWVWERGA